MEDKKTVKETKKAASVHSGGSDILTTTLRSKENHNNREATVASGDAG